MFIYIIVTIIGCVLACTNIISNDYIKLTIVMITLGFGLFGMMKSLSQTIQNEESEDK